MILIADSGSTKTDWVLASDDGLVIKSTQTEGITPVHQTAEYISQVLQSVCLLLVPESSSLAAIYFYGSGILPSVQSRMEEMLRQHFPCVPIVEAHSDLLGAARSLCGRSEGIACILGTGANSCLYDGKQIVRNTPPLGYILGDEGSGAVLGKLFLNALFKGVLPVSMQDDYLQSVGMSYSDIIDRIYRQPMANRFLASTSLFINKHLDSELLQQIVIDNFRQFVRRNIQPYQRPDLLLHSIGSIAWHYRELLQEAVTAEGYILGTVSKSPMKGLLLYHTQVS